MSKEWREEAKKSQNVFAICFRDRTWDKFSLPKEEQDLWKKIAYAIAGPPPNEKFEYPQDKKDQIEEIKAKCIEHSRKQGFNDVCMSFLFVHAYKDDKSKIVAPLVRLRRSDGKILTDSYFIDHTGRVYENWKDFLDANIFSGWWICVPQDADYAFNDDGSVKLTFSDQTERGKVLKGVDTAATATGIASTVALVAGIALNFIFPPAGLIADGLLIGGGIAGFASGAYSAGRSIENLADRSNHDQTINPFASDEARASWITVAASAFSFATVGSGAILSQTAKAGLLAGSELRAACTVLNITTVSVNGLGVINGIYEISKKKEVTSLDILQLAANIFFFTHSAVNFKTASAIIKDAQHEAIEAYKKEVAAGNRAAFDLIHKGYQDIVEPGEVHVMHGNKEFIRDLKKIDSKEEFFKAFEVVRENQLNVNRELVIDPKAFLQMNEKQRLDILKNSNDLQNGRITETQFYKNVSSISKEYRITFERQREQALSKIKKAFKVESVEDIEIGGRRIFSNLEPKDIDRLNQVLTDAGKNYGPDQLKVARAMADKVGCEDVTDFAAVAEYAIRRTNEEAKSIKERGLNPKPKSSKDRDTVYFFNQAAEKFLNNTEGFQDKVLKEFKSLRVRCDSANTAGNPRFKTAAAATNHYDKHPYFPRIDENNPVPPERYFEIAREMCGGPLKNPKWTQDGNSLLCKFESDKYGAVAVRYDNLLYGTSVIATLMKDDKPIGNPQLLP